MSKIIGSILIILGLIDYLTGFLQCSSVGYTLFGLIPSLDSIGAVRGCSMLTVFILIILVVMENFLFTLGIFQKLRLENI